jgi:transporter family-2 protein
MRMDRGPALFIPLAVGGVIALQPPANARLSDHVGDLGAAFISLLISVTIVGVIMAATGHAGRLSGLSDFRPVHLIGGIGGAGIVAVSLVTVRSLGAGAVVAALVCTQLLVALVVDRYGLFGVDEVALSAQRLAGAALLIAGTILITAR